MSPLALRSPLLRAVVRIAVLAAAVLPLTLTGPALAQAKQAAVLLFDGKLKEQAALDAAAREALTPHAEKVELRTMHAGRAETVPFLRLHRLTRADAPLLLLMDGPGEKAKILRRVRLTAKEEPDEAVRTVLKSLKLPLPRLDPPPPGPVLTLAADGGDAEKALLVQASGAGGVVDGARQIGLGGTLVYRLKLPQSLREADLQAEIRGNYVVEWSDLRTGPWKPLLDSYRYFGAAEDAVREPLRPVANLTPLLETLAGDLYLRVRTPGRGRNSAVLARLDVIALGMGEKSRQADWLAEAERIKAERLAALLPGSSEGTLLAGVLKGNTTLEKARSPYLMTGDVTVPASSVLTVEPGVTVRVVGKQALRVLGRLVAKGTAEEPVQFLSSAPGQPDDWKGIAFPALPLVPSRAAEGSVLQYCRIGNAAAVTLEGFRGEISHCIFQDSLSGLVLKGGGAGKVHHNRFQGCVQGLVVEGGAGEVRENEWRDCLVAVQVRSLHPKEALRFEGNSVRGVRQVAVQYPAQPSITRPPFLAPNNHWEGAVERLTLPAGETAEVRFDPRLESAPAGAGPGWGG